MIGRSTADGPPEPLPHIPRRNNYYDEDCSAGILACTTARFSLAVRLLGGDLSMTSKHSVVIVEAVRTAIGTFGGTLKDIPAVELGAAAINAAL